MLAATVGTSAFAEDKKKDLFKGSFAFGFS